ncbi:MAG: ketoacyl-ACP synthase III [Planctomycetaceae bacterium]|nr:ketoacyl-ACP synthase III [Planctomycetaceae bacterium]
MHSHPHFRAGELVVESSSAGYHSSAVKTKTKPKKRTEQVESRTKIRIDPPVSRPEPKEESRPLFKLSERTNQLLGVQIAGTGSYVPDRVVTNEELEETRGFEPGWIEQRSGIKERRYVAPGQATSDMCIHAARRAMADAGVTAEEVDLVLVGTFTPDYITPSTACLVQDALGIDAPAVDLSAACSGFMYALVTGSQYIATGNSRCALILGADTNSVLVNPNDQRTAPLFGDGAGAVILKPGSKEQGLSCYQLGSDGGGKESLYVPAGGSASRIDQRQLEEMSQYLLMDGRTVFKWAIQALTGTVDLVLRKQGLTTEDITLFIAHQANSRIISKATETLGIPSEKVFMNMHKYGNTSGGSIPIALDEARREGRFKPGDTLLLSGFGAGLSWGTALLRW